MQLRYTILYVQNVADTLAFYTHAFGLSQINRPEPTAC